MSTHFLLEIDENAGNSLFNYIHTPKCGVNLGFLRKSTVISVSITDCGIWQVLVISGHALKRAADLKRRESDQVRQELDFSSKTESLLGRGGCGTAPVFLFLSPRWRGNSKDRLVELIVFYPD